MYVNKCGIQPGYHLSWERIRLVHRIGNRQFVLYDAQGWRDNAPSIKALDEPVWSYGLRFRRRHGLPKELFTHDNRPVTAKQLPDSVYVLDQTMNRIYIAQADCPRFTHGQMFVAWQWEGDYQEDPLHIGPPQQRQTRVISTTSKKQLMTFAKWLEKLRECNRVVTELDPEMEKKNLTPSEDGGLVRRVYLAGATPMEAYAELPAGNWRFPDAAQFSVGTVVEDVPYFTWR